MDEPRGLELARLLRVLRRSLAMLLACFALAAAADGGRDNAIRYRYVSLWTALPAEFLFVLPVAVANSRAVVGTGWSCDVVCDPSIVVWRQGRWDVVVRHAQAYAASRSGVIGGALVLDPAESTEQALIVRDGRVEVLPLAPGDRSSHVIAVTDSGLALVETVDAAFQSHAQVVEPRGRVTPLEPPGGDVRFRAVNARGWTAGDRLDAPLRSRALRFDPASGREQVLQPVQGDPESQVQAMNSRGDVLGYSYTAGALERIGWWDAGGRFHVLFVEGTAQFPTVSNRLRWNERGLVVITSSRRDPNSYLVPRAGVRLRLSDLVDRLPTWTLIDDVNDRGDLLGTGGSSFFNVEDAFLLERIGEDDEAR